MSSESLFKEVSNKYYDLWAEGDPSFDFDLLPFDFEISATNHYVWSTLEEEYTTTLINNFNDYSTSIYSLYLLNKIIESYPDEQQISLRLEFTKIRLYYCLLKPNEFNNSLKFFCRHLCHQANHFTLPNYEDDDKSLKDKKKVFKNWKKFEILHNAIKNNDFDLKTYQFRNHSQHELPHLLEIGLSRFVSRSKADYFQNHLPFSTFERLNSYLEKTYNKKIDLEKKRPKYSFGSRLPLTTKDMIPILLEERQAMKDKFYFYWDLVKEMEAAICSLPTLDDHGDF